MRKSEIFAEILSAVSQETEVTEAQILSSCKHTEAVDARAILAKLLSEQGFYPVQTAASMHRTAQSACLHRKENHTMPSCQAKDLSPST